LITFRIVRDGTLAIFRLGGLVGTAFALSAEGRGFEPCRVKSKTVKLSPVVSMVSVHNLKG